jgi:hypothetical protein
MNDTANVIVEAISEYAMLQMKRLTPETHFIPLK